MARRVADRTHLGPDHRAPDDVPLDGIDEDLDTELVDLDHLAHLFEPSWITVTPRSEYL